MNTDPRHERVKAAMSALNPYGRVPTWDELATAALTALTEPTQSDREKAVELLTGSGLRTDGKVAEGIAQALADQRAAWTVEDRDLTERVAQWLHAEFKISDQRHWATATDPVKDGYRRTAAALLHQLSLVSLVDTQAEVEWAAVERNFEEDTRPAEGREVAEFEVRLHNQNDMPSYLAKREVRYGPWIEVTD